MISTNDAVYLMKQKGSLCVPSFEGSWGFREFFIHPLLSKLVEVG